MKKSNFIYLKKEYQLLFNIGQSAEFYLYQDPVTSIFKLRQFGEKLSELLFELHFIEFPYENTFHNRLKTLQYESLGSVASAKISRFRDKNLIILMTQHADYQ